LVISESGNFKDISINGNLSLPPDNNTQLILTDTNAIGTSINKYGISTPTINTKDINILGKSYFKHDINIDGYLNPKNGIQIPVIYNSSLSSSDITKTIQGYFNTNDTDGKSMLFLFVNSTGGNSNISHDYSLILAIKVRNLNSTTPNIVTFNLASLVGQKDNPNIPYNPFNYIINNTQNLIPLSSLPSTSIKGN